MGCCGRGQWWLKPLPRGTPLSREAGGRRRRDRRRSRDDLAAWVCFVGRGGRRGQGFCCEGPMGGPGGRTYGSESNSAPRNNATDLCLLCLSVSEVLVWLVGPRGHASVAGFASVARARHIPSARNRSLPHITSHHTDSRNNGGSATYAWPMARRRRCSCPCPYPLPVLDRKGILFLAAWA